MGGIQARTTAAQRAEVRRLRSEGVSIRGIAVEVFGDVRYRGRVERVLRPSLEPTADVDFPPLDIRGLSNTEVIRALFERRLAYWAASGEAPSLQELRLSLDVQRRLEAQEQLARLNESTRERFAVELDGAPRGGLDG